MVSFASTQRSSIPEETTPEELSDGESPNHDTRATSMTSESTIIKHNTSNVRSKSKTAFRLAHPPPISIHKQHLHIRPRVLLQLQKISGTTRPKPVLEVAPSIVCASRLARRFPRTFKGKAGLGADDLVILNSEDYKSDGFSQGESEDMFEGDNWGKREIVAAICQPGKDEVEGGGKAEILMCTGSSWTVLRLASGAYEFVSLDDHGLQTVARWVPKQPKGVQRTPTLGMDRSTSEERKFSFSLLNPNSRRHAIIACLDRHTIEVSDTYIDPQTVRNDTESATPTISSSSTSEESPARNPIQVSHSLRTLIVVTGICVAFEEGFSSRFSHSNTAPSSPNLGLGSKHQRRSLSLSSGQLGSETISSPVKSTFGNMHRARASFQQTRSSSAVPLSPKAGEVRDLPQRSTSSGGSFKERFKGRNSTAIQNNQLGIIVSSDAERTPTKKDLNSNSSGLTQSSVNTDWEAGRRPPLLRVPSDQQYGAADASIQVQTGKRRTRRLSRLFGFSRKSSGTA